jgi:Na+-transporting NADH:ubiquinone oxidoreductase subunit A
MTRIVKIRRGLTIKLKGEAERKLVEYNPEMFSVQPAEFRILHPRLLVAENDQVLAGTPLVHDKKNERIVLTSPVSGKIAEIRRGEKRKLEHIVIESDNLFSTVEFGALSTIEADRRQIVDKLLVSGLWPVIRQRPYAIIADPEQVPDAIFISGFDTAPLAPDMVFIMQQHQPDEFQAGIDVLKKLTSGSIHMNVHPKLGIPDYFLQTKQVQINQFFGPHPASNIGVQIHHIMPIMKGDVIWYVDPQDVVAIGKLFTKGILDRTKIFACTGSEFKDTYYFKSRACASVRGIVKGNLKQPDTRIISGNVLTGTTILPEGYIGFYDKVVTAIPEGHYHEFFGWAAPGLNKFSNSRTYFSWLFKNRSYRLDTNKHGELRAFVMTGEYDKVFPMNIMPVQLLKSIIVRDFEQMEQFGIYEVAEEDFALCEVVCTSKIESQSIVREGIDFMIKETN